MDVQSASQASASLVKFHSKDELRRYMKSLVEYYQGVAQGYGDQLGTLLRTIEQEKGSAKVPGPGKVVAKGWVRMGTMLVNTGDSKGAMAEVLFQAHEETKSRLSKISEAVKSFDEQSNSVIPEAGLYYLQLKNGIPERIVADTAAKSKDSFKFSAAFQVV
jgi:hypothetical protein